MTTEQQNNVELYAFYITSHGGFSQGRDCDYDAALCQWLENGAENLTGDDADMAAALAEWVDGE